MHTTSTLDDLGDLGDGRTPVVIRQRNVPETMRGPYQRLVALREQYRMRSGICDLVNVVAYPMHR